MKKALYVRVSTPLEFRMFTLHNAPTGWYRIDILKNKLKEDVLFRMKFTESEIRKIFSY